MADPRFRRVAATAAAALLLAGAWSASATEPLDPNGAVELALAGNPLVAAADSAVREARAGHELVRSAWLPRLRLSENWVRSNDPVFVFGSKLRQESFGAADFGLDALNTPDPLSSAATRVSLEQNVWDADRTRLGARAADLDVEAMALDRRRTRDEVAIGALRAFWDAVLADEALGVAEDAEAAARAHVELAAALVEEGLAVASDRMSAEVRLAEVRALRIRARAGATVARAALNRALGVSADRSFRLLPPAVEATADAADPEALVAEALAARSDLQGLDRRIAQARIGERMARSGRLPVIGAAAGYEWNGPDPLDATGDSWMVGLSITLPLFDGQESRRRAARLRAGRERAEQLRQALTDGIRLEVLAARAERESAAGRVAVARIAEDQAAEALRIVRDRYSEGLALVVELLGAEAAHTQARAGGVRARRDLALADAELALALGRPIEPTDARATED